MSSRDSLDEILDVLIVDTLTSGRAGTGKKKAKQSLHKWALDIIGEDEGTNGGQKLTYDHAKQARDAFRVDLKAKLKGDVDES